MRALALLLLLAAGPVGAQQATPQTPQTPAEPAQKEKAKERRPLDLRLDNPSSFATITPAEKPPARELPTLGGDAKPVNPTLPSESRSFPKDTNPNN